MPITENVVTPDSITLTCIIIKDDDGVVEKEVTGSCAPIQATNKGITETVAYAEVRKERLAANNQIHCGSPGSVVGVCGLRTCPASIIRVHSAKSNDLKVVDLENRVNTSN